jgi:hypothetical protein
VFAVLLCTLLEKTLNLTRRNKRKVKFSAFSPNSKIAVNSTVIYGEGRNKKIKTAGVVWCGRLTKRGLVRKNSLAGR